MVITSADGTAVDHRTTGSGPGLLVIPGPMEAADDYQDLADALADEFTVHVVDRRGRGESGPHRAGHGLRAEVEDVSAVVRATGAQRLLGVSSGAVVALQTALQVPGITQVVAYEPPFGLVQRKGGILARFEKEVAAGQHVEAMITLFKGLEIGPRWLRLVPRWVFVTVIRKAQGEPDDLAERLPVVRHELRVVEEGGVNLARFSALRSRVLLLGGSTSPRHFTDGLHALAELLPRAEKILVEDAHQLTPAENPGLILPALRNFLGA